MAGPEENRLRAALTGAEGMAVSRGATDWQALSTLLTEVSMALKKSRVVAEELGGTTGPTLGGAFDRAAVRLDDRSRELQMGNQALTDSSSVIEQARDALHRMEQEHSAPEPAPFTPTPRWQLRTAQDVQDEKDRQGAHQGAANAYAADQAARERISRQWADRMDRTFHDSTETMKQIHGLEPEGSGDPGRQPAPGAPAGRLPGRGPLPGGADGGGTGADQGDGGSQGDEDGHRHDDQGGLDVAEHGDDHDQIGGDHDGHVGDGRDEGTDLGPLGAQVPSGSEHGGGSGLGTVGGVAVAGAGGGALAAGIRGLAVPSSVSSAGVRPIGSTSRSAVSGALGRSGAVTPGAPVTRTGAAGGTGRGSAAGRGVTGTGPAGRGTPGVGQAGTRGGRASGGRVRAGRATGGRSGAGSAAVGGIGTGRGRSGRDEDERQQRRRDLFDDGSDWLDDEGAAPDVLG